MHAGALIRNRPSLSRHVSRHSAACRASHSTAEQLPRYNIGCTSCFWARAVQCSRVARRAACTHKPRAFTTIRSCSLPIPRLAPRATHSHAAGPAGSSLPNLFCLARARARRYYARCSTRDEDTKGGPSPPGSALALPMIAASFVPDVPRCSSLRALMQQTTVWKSTQTA